MFGQRFTNAEMERLEREYETLVTRICNELRVPFQLQAEVKREMFTQNAMMATVDQSIDRFNQLDLNQMARVIQMFIEQICNELTAPPQQSRFSSPPAGGGIFGGGGGGRSVFSNTGGGGGFPAQQGGGSRLSGRTSRLSSPPADLSGNAYAARHMNREQERAKQEQVPVQEVQEQIQTPQIITLNDNPNVDKVKMNNDDKDLIVDEYLDTVVKGTILVPGQTPMAYHDIRLKTPMNNVCQIIKLLKSSYTDMVSAPSWVVNVTYPALVCDNVIDPLGKYISSSFSKTAEKLSTLTHLDSFMSVFLPALTSQFNDNKYVYQVLLKEFNKYLEYFLRDPENPLSFLELQSWGDVIELFDTSSATMRSYVQVNPDLKDYLWKLVKSAVDSVFVDGKSPIIDPTVKDNRGIIASHPHIQIKKGKYLLRDYGMMNAETWKKFEAELQSTYVIRQVMRKVTLTNQPKDNVLPESEKVIVPVGSISSAVHWTSWSTTKMHLLDQEGIQTHLPITLLAGYDETNQKIAWSKQQGMLLSGDVIYF